MSFGVASFYYLLRTSSAFIFPFRSDSIHLRASSLINRQHFGDLTTFDDTNYGLYIYNHHRLANHRRFCLDIIEMHYGATHSCLETSFSLSGTISDTLCVYFSHLHRRRPLGIIVVVRLISFTPCISKTPRPRQLPDRTACHLQRKIYYPQLENDINTQETACTSSQRPN